MNVYTENNLIHIARRRNNTKRNYLIVNPLQGKHLPVHPCKALDMMRDLGNLICDAYPNERIVCIGFAETATAIGAVAAECNNVAYIHTTRENYGRDFFFFSEEHSHAVEQKLCSDKWETLTGSADRIVFVEDEISTGKTIKSIVSLLLKNGAVQNNMRFSAASLLNLMGIDDMRRFLEAKIDPLYLLKTENNGFESRAAVFENDDSLLYDARNDAPKPAENKAIKIIGISGKTEPRQGVTARIYTQSCLMLAEKLAEHFAIAQLRNKKILVLGTEECMYPALFTADYFERANPHIEVYTHATTRTPIALSSAADYPVAAGYCLRSVYDAKRITFLYNLTRYDLAALITDSELRAEDLLTPLGDIQSALARCGTDNFFPVQWVP